MEQYLSVQRDELIHTSVWMHLRILVLGERSQTGLLFYSIYMECKVFIVTESSSLVVGGLGMEGIERGRREKLQGA